MIRSMFLSLRKLAADKNDGFTELYHILKEDGAGLDGFGSGVAPEGLVDVETQREQVELFRKKWDTLEKLE